MVRLKFVPRPAHQYRTSSDPFHFRVRVRLFLSVHHPSPITLLLPRADRHYIIPLQSHISGSEPNGIIPSGTRSDFRTTIFKITQETRFSWALALPLLRVITLRNFDPRNLVNNVLRTVCDEKGSGSDRVSRNRLRLKISCPNYSVFVNPQSVLIAFYVLISVELFIKNFFATPPPFILSG